MMATQAATIPYDVAVREAHRSRVESNAQSQRVLQRSVV
jgi:hypothetical protein